MVGRQFWELVSSTTSSTPRTRHGERSEVGPHAWLLTTLREQRIGSIPTFSADASIALELTREMPVQIRPAPPYGAVV